MSEDRNFIQKLSISGLKSANESSSVQRKRSFDEKESDSDEANFACPECDKIYSRHPLILDGLKPPVVEKRKRIILRVTVKIIR